MREIKFRAWDNVDFKMYYLGEEENIHFYFRSDGIMAERFTNIKTVVVDEEVDDVHCEKLEHLKYMQYSGLKDKNGTKIYEGDIIHFKTYKGEGFSCPIGTDIYYKIVFTEHNPNCNTIGEYIGFWAENKHGNLTSIQYLTHSHGAEVIGSIYENPELLEGNDFKQQGLPNA